MLQVNDNGDLDGLTYIENGITRRPSIVYIGDEETGVSRIWDKPDLVYVRFDINVESTKIYVDTESIVDLGDGTTVTLNPGENTITPVASPIYLESVLGLTKFAIRSDNFLHIDIKYAETLTTLEGLCFNIDGMDTFNATNLISFTMKDGENILSMDSTFFGATSLESISIGSTEHVTNFNNTFTECANLAFPLNIDTSSGINFFEAFSYCSMEEIELLDLSSAQSLNSMFSYCTNLKTIPTLIIPDGTTIHAMFSNCTSLSEVPNIDFSSVTIATGTFFNCTGILIVNNLNLAKATDIGSMFAGCSNVSTIGTINAPLNTTLQNTFGGCTNLGSIADLDMPLLTRIDEAFMLTRITKCPIISSGTHLTKVSDAYSGTNIMNSPYVLENTSKIVSMDGLFENCINLTNVGTIGVEHPELMNSAFKGCSVLESIGGINLLGTSTIDVDADQLFRDCSSLVCIGDMGDIPLHSLTTDIFTGCSSLLYPDPTEQNAIVAALSLLWDNPGDCPST